ncbi:MAG: class I SAM-dependent methyltransferase, partial [Saprospiraceae bacterium]|nr:class I SAM-dependent methyltransferase [Saprospiraceae bacterium]
AFSSPESSLLTELTRQTHLRTLLPNMLSGHIQGAFLSMISKMMTPNRILEIGTFTGYASLCLAEGLAEKGVLHTIEVNEELEPFILNFFSKSLFAQQIKLHIGDAKEIISSLNEIFDLVFIDAAKLEYSAYYDLVFPSVKIGGYIIADNVLWSGKVINEKHDKDTAAIHSFNDKVNKDSRVENYILPLRDGLNIIRKISE